LISSPSYQSRDDAFFGFTGIKVPALLQYSFNGKRVIPFINAGFSTAFITKNDYLHINEIKNGTNDIYTSQDQNLGFNRNEVSFVASAGFKIRLMNKFFLNLEGRFEYGSGLFNVRNFVTPVKERSKQFSFSMGLNF
jgi:hypothetical protein